MVKPNGHGYRGVSTDWSSGNIRYKDASGNIIFTIDGANRKLTLPASSTLDVSAATVSGIASSPLTSSGANAFAVGRQGATKPAFNVDASASSSVTGLNVAAAATGSGVAVSVIEAGGTNNNLTVDAMGSGMLTLNGTATGAVVVGHGLTLTDTSAAATLALGSTNGVKVGATGDKIFLGATPIVRRTGAAQAAVDTTGATNSSPYGYGQTQADAIVTLVNELRAMIAFGLIKGSS